MTDIFEKVKDRVNIADVVERFGVELNSRDKGLCPFHNEKTPSFSVKKRDNTWKCFGCGEGGDAIDFVAKLKGIEPLEAVKTLAEMYGIDIASDKPIPKKFDVKAYIQKCIAEVGQTNYFAKRGLIAATVKKYCLGYDSYRKAVVIPYSGKLTYYQTRSVEDKKFYKPKTEDCGAEPLFNGDAMYKSKDPVFVVESPICALSIMQCGAAAIALCGVGNSNKLIKEVKSKKPTATLILSLDNDEPGHKASQEIANQLFDLGVKFDVSDVAGNECNDPNELLMKDAAQLKANVQAAVKAAKLKYTKLTKLFSAEELQKRRIRPIQWIVRGVLPEGLAIICAPSKYGKSWMMMQLCEAVADGKPFLDFETEKCDCMYFSLEDSDRRFQDRLNKTMQGKSAPSNFYGSTECSTMQLGLFKELEELMELYPRIKLIIIDTFQKVRGGAGKTESAYSADYREMGEFKKFAEKHGLCILLVHHMRKQMDDADIYNRINGSMGIMGAADTILMLSRKKRDDENTTLILTGRDVEDKELVVCFDKTTFQWQVIGTAEEEAYRKAKSEYENNPVIKTIKALIEKTPSGWCGNCSELKAKIYEITGQLYSGTVESIGKTISKYLDRLLSDGIEHKNTRGKRHCFAKKQRTLWDYTSDNDD